MSGDASKTKYALAFKAEALAALACCTSPKFWASVGHAMDPERMPRRGAELLVQAARAVARTTGSPCTSAAVAIQHLRTLQHDGKLKRQDVMLAGDVVDEAREEGGVEDVEALVASVAPVIQKESFKQVIEDLYLKSHQVEDFGDASEKVARVTAIGKSGGEVPVALSGAREDVVGAFTTGVREPVGLGVPDLDHKLHGGLERGGLGVILAGTGVAKSAFLCHAAGQAFFAGYNVLYVTLELSVAEVKSRVYRNLTGMTRQEVLQDPDEVVRRMQLLRDRGGALKVVYMQPGDTTVQHVEALLREQEREHRFSPDVWLIDPVDDLIDKGSNTKSWEVMNKVFVKLRDLVHERQAYCWCSSQMVRGENRGKRPNVNTVAGAMAKVRKATLVMGAWRTESDEESGMIRWCVPKRTAVETFGSVGPLKHELDRGRIAAVDREEPWSA